LKPDYLDQVDNARQVIGFILLARQPLDLNGDGRIRFLLTRRKRNEDIIILIHLEGGKVVGSNRLSVFGLSSKHATDFVLWERKYNRTVGACSNVNEL